MMSQREQAVRQVGELLRGVPVALDARCVNALLRPWYAAHRPCRYGTWRWAVRAVQRERARWCHWEARPEEPRVRPLRRGRRTA